VDGKCDVGSSFDSVSDNGFTRAGARHETPPADRGCDGGQRRADKLDGSIKFYFGNQPPPLVVTVLGSDVSNRKTNDFSKSDEQACNWAFLSAVEHT
jgi:hypothetical protein